MRVEMQQRRQPTATGKAILIFVGICFTLSIAVSLIVALTGGKRSPVLGLRWSTMFLPAIAVLVMSAGMSESPRSLGWNRFPVIYALVAVLLMPVILHAVMLPLVARGHGGHIWQSWLTPAADGLYYPPAQRGWGTVLTRSELAGRIVLNAVAGMVAVSVLAFFEEVGWRAWLLPRLAARIGERRAIISVAAIWALWHAPFVLSGILHIEGMPVSTAALILPVGQFGAGLVIGWLWVQTRSIWVVMLAHGALNNWGQYAFKFTQDFEDRQAFALAAGAVALVVLGAVLLAATTRRLG